MIAYQVQTDGFEGPLDLLVCLVRAGEVDILEIAIGEIAGRYVDYLRSAGRLDMEEVGEFLVLASTLVEYKSRILLPADVPDEEPSGDESPREELVRQLLEYKRFKEAAQLLWKRARDQQQKLARLVDDGPPATTNLAQQPIRELELWDLVSAFSRLMKENIVPVADSIEKDPTPIAFYMQQLEARVVESGCIGFFELLGNRNTKPQIIGKFLALLELIKRQSVWIELDESTNELLIFPATARPVAQPAFEPIVETDDRPAGATIDVPRQDAESWIRMASDDAPPEMQPDTTNLHGDFGHPSRDAGSASAWADFESILDDDSDPPN